MTQATDLLQYFATYPKAMITYRASSMILFVHSDDFDLSEPKVGSRLGVVECMGSQGDEDKPPTPAPAVMWLQAPSVKLTGSLSSKPAGNHSRPGRLWQTSAFPKRPL
jgi:hypothetical protein